MKYTTTRLLIVQTTDIMGEPHRPGDHWSKLKWCRCMNACGPVEDKYSILAKGTINSLHLIRELYDHDILHDHMRIYLLTEKTYEAERERWLIPQVPFPKKKTWADIVSQNR